MTAPKSVTPADLQKVTEQVLRAKVEGEFDRAKKHDEEQRALREAFMTRDVEPHPALEFFNAAVHRAAEQGLREVQILKFPASYCNDNGRRINNGDPDWADSLEGFAKRGVEFFVKELRPLGFKARAQILSYPGGMPGDVGLFVSW